jgi:hypothetical protein
VRNGMTADKPGANNTRSDLENNDDDFLWSSSTKIQQGAKKY